ncbi:MAG: tetratricopeptide repeat protein [Bacteroidia bacterium]
MMKRFILILMLASQLANAQQPQVYIEPEQYYKQGYDLFTKEKYGAAILEFDKALEQKNVSRTTQINALYFSAVCSAELFNKDAEIKLRNFVEEYPAENKTRLAAWQLAKVYYKQRQWKRSVEWFEKSDVTQLTPDEITEFYFKSGYAYFMSGDLVKASKNFHEIINVDSKYNGAANFYYAHIAYANNNYETALKSFNKLSESEAFAPVAPYYVAQIYFQQGKYDDVISHTIPALDKPNLQNVPDMKRLIAESYYRKNDYANAAKYFEDYQRTSPNLNRSDIYELGYCYYSNGDYEKAIASFNKVINLDDSLAQNANYHLAACFIKTGNKSSARNAFLFASKKDFNPKIKEDALFNYGKLSYELNATSAAINAFRDFIKQYPGTPKSDQSLEYLAQLYLTTRDYKQALAALESISNKSSNAKAAYQKVAYYRGIEFYNDVDLPKAISMFDKTIVNNTDALLSAKAIYWKGEALYRQNNFDAAIAENKIFLTYPSALRLDFYNDGNYNQGYCYFKKENYGEALICYRKYIKDKNSTDAKRYNDAVIRIADASFMLRDYETAKSSYAEAIANKDAASDYCYFQQGMIAGLQGNMNVKIQSMQKIEDNYKKSAYFDDALYEKGVALFANDNSTEALKQFNRVVTEFPSSNYVIKARLKTGLIYYNNGDNAKAIDAYKEVVQNYPQSPEANEALEGMRNAFIKEGKPDEFITFANNLPGPKIANGAQDTIFYDAAEQAYQNGDYVKAGDAFATYLSRFPDGSYSLNATFYKAECDYAAKKYDDALKGYEIITEKPTSDFSEKALLKAAALNFLNKNYAKSLLQFQKLEQVANFKDNITASLSGQMRCNYSMNNYDACITAAQKLLATDKVPNDLINEAHLYNARCAMIKEDLTTAQNEYTSVDKIQTGVRAAEAKYNLAVIEYKLKNYKNVGKRVHELEKMNPSYDYWLAKGYIIWGDAYIAQGDTFQAKGTYKSIADNYERNPDDADDVRQIAQDKYDALTKDENKIFKKEEEVPEGN